MALSTCQPCSKCSIQHPGGSWAGDLPIFRLDLPRIFENPDIDEQVPRRLQASRQVNVRPLALVRGEQVAVLPDIVLFLGAETAARVGVARGGCAIGPGCWLAGKIEDIGAVPHKFFELVGACPMVGQEAALVSSDGQVVDEKGACRGLLDRGVKGALKRLQQAGHVPVQVADFAGYGPDQLGLVWREMREVLCSFGVLNLADM